MLTRMNSPDAAVDVLVEVVESVSDELLEAVTRLVPQLSRSSPPPDRRALESIVASGASTLLVASAPTRPVRGKIIGMLTLVTFDIPTGTRAVIEDVVVDEQARGRGIGGALTREAVAIAAVRGAKTVDLTSRPEREAANRLYRSIGFEQRNTNVYRLTIGPGAT